MNFKDACQAKFNKGAEEHRQPWDSNHINAIEEIRGELCDLYNYSTLLHDQEMAWDIQTWTEGLWNKLN